MTGLRRSLTQLSALLCAPPSALPQPPSDRDWPHQLMLFLALSLLYLTTAPRGVVLEDDGLFILSAWFLGIEHPPGYPLFVLLGKLATLVPLGSVAWRVHALNGLIAALACVLVYRIARQLIPGRAPAYLAGAGLGVSATFWSQAIIADVYPLHALLFFALLYLALAQGLQPTSAMATRRRATQSALLVGFGLANHWPLLLLSGPGLLLLWLPSWRALLKHLPRLFLALAIGLLPYAWMVWRSQQQPPISYQGPIQDLGELVRYILRSNYAGVDHSASAGIADRLLFLSFLIRQTAAQLLLPGAALALAGTLVQWLRWGGRIASALTLAFIGPTLILLALLEFDYQPLQREAFRVYPLVAWGILALWAGLGLRWLTSRLPTRQRAPAAMLGATALIGATLLAHWAQNDRRDDWLASAYAETLLAALGPNATLLISDDATLPSTAYLHLIEGQRPDVRLISETALVLEPRPFDPNDTPGRERRARIDALIATAEGPVYRLHNRDLRSGAFGWLAFRVDPTSAPGDAQVTFRLRDGEKALLARLTEVEGFAHGWTELLRRVLLTAFIDFQTRAELVGQWPYDDAELMRARDRALKLPEAALTRAETLFATGIASHRPEATGLLVRAMRAIDDPELSKNHVERMLRLAKQTRLERSAGGEIKGANTARATDASGNTRPHRAPNADHASAPGDKPLPPLPQPTR